MLMANDTAGSTAEPFCCRHFFAEFYSSSTSRTFVHLDCIAMRRGFGLEVLEPGGTYLPT